MMIMKEIWKDIKDYEDSYQCSNYGNIRTVDRYVTEKTGKQQFRKGQIIKVKQNKNGYLQFGLNKDGKRKMAYVHIIVAQTFITNSDNLPVVNHIDGNKLNNRVDNLEWCSYSKNNKHSYDELNRSIVKDGGSPKAVYIIDTINKSLLWYESISETTKHIELSHTQINRYIHSNKKWKGRYIFLTDSDKCVEDIERVS